MILGTEELEKLADALEEKLNQLIELDNAHENIEQVIIKLYDRHIGKGATANV
jgi:DNA-binding SARP family transcriptional activator